MSTTLAKKVEQAAKYVLILNHEEPVTDPAKIIWDGLRKLGIFDDNVSYELLMSNECKEGDARAIFCDQMNMPVPRFRKIWGILKEGTKEVAETTMELSKVVEYIKPIGQLSNKDLLQRYKDNPDDSSVEEELKKRSQEKNCIAFYKEEIDVDLSASLLSKAKKGIQIPTVLSSNGKIYRIRAVGHFPQETYEVCPVTETILFENYSEALGVTWRIPLESRQFIWLMKDQGIKIDAFVANNIQDLYEQKGMDGLKLQYPKIAELFENLSELGELPTLKTNVSSKYSKSSDPFRGNRKF